jgi:hypothetical protein
MVNESRQARLRELLAGEDLRSEAGQTALRWLSRELAEKPPAGWESRTTEAFRLALDIYWDFMREYNAFYEEPEGGGAVHVARALRGRFGQADPHLSEAVLDRIRNRRVHLLDSFRRKYQPSLFAPPSVEARKIRGYLIRVAALESLHIPASDLPWGAGRTVNLAALAEPAAPTAELDGPDPRRLADLLNVFWSRANGFTAEQRLEGLTSLGLGYLTGIPSVEEFCRELLRKKLPGWEETAMRLRRRAGQWLTRLEDTQRQQAAATDPGQRERLAERLAVIDANLQRVRSRLARHPVRLRPRAAEVQEALAGSVANVGNTRFRRIAREIALFQDRVRTGGQVLRRALGSRIPPDVESLIAEIEMHLGNPPASPRAHGLNNQERAVRETQASTWRRQAEELLGRVRGHVRLFFGFPLAGDVNEPILRWLADAEDLYEFGILRRKGVMAGLGRRHGWRLEHLLRTT